MTGLLKRVFNTLCHGPECARPVHCLNLCKTHYEQARQGKPLRPIQTFVPRGTIGECTFPGCNRPHSSRGLCAAHYGQFKRGGPLKPIRSWVSQGDWGPTCRYTGCRKRKHSRGLCIIHYGRGISQFARDAILEAQTGLCLCGRSDPGREGWQLDHAHVSTCTHSPDNYCSSCARGLLCLPCNRHAVAWYETVYRMNRANAPIPLLEAWISRRLRFTGDLDASDVRVTVIKA